MQERTAFRLAMLEERLLAAVERLQEGDRDGLADATGR